MSSQRYSTRDEIEDVQRLRIDFQKYKRRQKRIHIHLQNQIQLLQTQFYKEKSPTHKSGEWTDVWIWIFSIVVFYLVRKMLMTTLMAFNGVH